MTHAREFLTLALNGTYEISIDILTISADATETHKRRVMDCLPSRLDEAINLARLHLVDDQQAYRTNIFVGADTSDRLAVVVTREAIWRMVCTGAADCYSCWHSRGRIAKPLSGNSGNGLNQQTVNAHSANIHCAFAGHVHRERTPGRDNASGRIIHKSILYGKYFMQMYL